MTGDFDRAHVSDADVSDPLHVSEARFRTLAAATPAAIFECDMEGTIHFANERWFDLVAGDGPSSNVSTSDGLVDRIHPDDLTELAELWDADQHRTAPEGFAARCRLVREADSWRWIDIRLTPTPNTGGLPRAYIGVLHDVTDLVEARHASQRFQTILETTSDLVAIVDADLGLSYLNPAARAAAGIEDAETANAGEVAVRLLGDDYTVVMANALEAFKSSSVWSGETPFRRASGVPTTLSHVVVQGLDEDGTPWYASLARDLSENRVQVSTTSNTERHDGLTGLLNRAAVFAEVRSSLDRVRGTPLRVGILSIDVDQFQLVNDSYGHDVGDELLIQIAQRLRASSGPNTVLGRFGSDDFIVLVEGMTSQAAMLARAQFLSERLTGEVQLSAGPAHLTVSIGVITDDGSTDAGALLRDVDATASVAKSRGRAQIEVFDHRVHDQVVTRLATELEIRHGLAQDQFHLHFQPVIGLRSRNIVGFEALVRWQHPRYGLLGPDAFLSVVEECGLSQDLGSLVLAEAIATAADWKNIGFDGVIAVNVSADQLYAGDLVAEISQLLHTHGLEGRRLCVEVTEGIVMADNESAAKRLQELRDQGVTVAIDDFGTGYSSLSHLTRLPVDVLKVDKTFVQGLGMQAHDDAVTATVVRLGQSLGLHVTAEGVETPEQLEALELLGCDAIQGFLFSRPVGAEAIPGLLATDFAAVHQPR